MKKQTIKIFALVMVAFLLAATLVGCGNTNASSETGGKIKLGFIQLFENTAFEDMRNGFLDRLKQKGYTNGENMEFIYKNAQGDMAALNTICQQLVSQKVDMLVAIATPPAQVALQTLQAQNSSIPLVFISISDPLHAGLVTDMQAPDFGATGTQNVIPIEANFKLMHSLTPDAKTFGFLYTTGETNAVVTINQAKQHCQAQGFEFFEATPANSSEVAAAAATLFEKCDAVFVPNDSVIQSVMAQVAQIAIDAGKALYGSSATMVEAGALATVSTADYEIGQASADMAAEILGGKSVAQLPVKVVTDVVTVINKNTLDAMKLQLPEELTKDAIFVETT